MTYKHTLADVMIVVLILLVIVSSSQFTIAKCEASPTSTFNFSMKSVWCLNNTWIQVELSYNPEFGLYSGGPIRASLRIIKNELESKCYAIALADVLYGNNTYRVGSYYIGLFDSNSPLVNTKLHVRLNGVVNGTGGASLIFTLMMIQGSNIIGTHTMILPIVLKSELPSVMTWSDILILKDNIAVLEVSTVGLWNPMKENDIYVKMSFVERLKDNAYILVLLKYDKYSLSSDFKVAKANTTTVFFELKPLLPYMPKNSTVEILLLSKVSYSNNEYSFSRILRIPVCTEPQLNIDVSIDKTEFYEHEGVTLNVTLYNPLLTILDGIKVSFKIGDKVEEIRSDITIPPKTYITVSRHLFVPIGTKSIKVYVEGSDGKINIYREVKVHVKPSLKLITVSNVIKGSSVNLGVISKVCNVSGVVEMLAGKTWTKILDFKIKEDVQTIRVQRLKPGAYQFRVKVNYKGHILTSNIVKIVVEAEQKATPHLLLNQTITSHTQIPLRVSFILPLNILIPLVLTVIFSSVLLWKRRRR